MKGVIVKGAHIEGKLKIQSKDIKFRMVVSRGNHRWGREVDMYLLEKTQGNLSYMITLNFSFL